MSIKPYLVSLRLQTLALSLSGIILGSFMAFRYGYFDGVVFTLALLTTISLQILSNLANEWGDLSKGTDNKDRLGPKRSMQTGEIPLPIFRAMIWCFGVLSALFGVALVWVSFDSLLTRDGMVMLALGACAIVAAITYTVGRKAYGYYGLGDLFVFIFFGLVSVLGSSFLMMQRIEPLLLLPAVACGLLSTGVLNVNNLRDIENDRACGKRTLAVRLGQRSAKVYHTGLIIGAFVAMGCFCFLKTMNWYFLCTLPLFAIHLHRIYSLHGAALNPQLKVLSLSTFAFCLCASLL